LRKITLSIVAAAVAVTSATATEWSKYEISPMVGKYFPAKGKNLEDKAALGLRLDRELNKDWSLDLAYDHVNKMNDKEKGDKTGADIYALSGLYKFGTFDKFTPFGLIGANYQDFGKDAEKRKDGIASNLGLGAKYAITDMVALRAEARHLYSISKPNSDYIASIGLSFALGEKSKPAPIVVAPVPAPKPEVKVEEKPAVQVATPIVKVEAPVVNAAAKKVVQLKVNFDSSKSIIKKQYMKEIEAFAAFMKENPSMKVELQGHTDPRGSKKLNAKLSLARAEAIKAALIKAGISADRLTVKGYESQKPEVANDTKENMAKNRRSLAVIISE
jgi:OmpA-OmpF porin, OOP family